MIKAIAIEAMVEFEHKSTMGLNIKNREVEALATELAALTGESKTEVIRQALLHEKAKLALPSVDERVKSLEAWLEDHVWSKLPPEVRGKGIPQSEQDEILGYGPDGV